MPGSLCGVALRQGFRKITWYGAEALGDVPRHIPGVLGQASSIVAQQLKNLQTCGRLAPAGGSVPPTTVSQRSAPP